MEVRGSWADAGGGLSARDALIVHRQREFRLLLAFGIVSLACLAAAAWLLIQKGAPTAKAFAGLAGVGGGGFMAGFLKSWRDWSRTDLLLILIDEATKAQIATMIDKLIAKL